MEDDIEADVGESDDSDAVADDHLDDLNVVEEDIEEGTSTQ